MRAVVQRVRSAAVTVGSEEISKIGPGLAILLGVAKDDVDSGIRKFADKIANLRIFEDEQGKMNISLLDIGADALVVSQFTLYADCRKGRRPGFDMAAAHDQAEMLYNRFVDELRGLGVTVKTGQFQAKMLFSIENDGPVTIVLDSSEL